MHFIISKLTCCFCLNILFNFFQTINSVFKKCVEKFLFSKFLYFPPEQRIYILLISVICLPKICNVTSILSTRGRCGSYSAKQQEKGGNRRRVRQRLVITETPTMANDKVGVNFFSTISLECKASSCCFDSLEKHTV